MDDINIRMAGIAEKLATIRAMAERKQEIYGKIQQTMSRKAAAKEKMTTEQIVEYQRFATFYNSEVAILNRQIDELGVILKFIEEGQVHTDYGNICAKLKLIDQKQSGVISGLHSVVEMGKRTLLVL